MAQLRSSSLSHDNVYSLLSNARRRYVLYYLRQADNPVQIGDLTDHLAAWENETDVEGLEPNQRKRVYVSLYQTHLPNLEDAGLVEFDEDRGTVRLTGRSDELGEFVANGNDRPDQNWHRWYLAIALVGGLVYVLAQISVPLIGSLPGFVVGLAVVASFAVVAVLHNVDANERRSEHSLDVLIEE